MSRPSAEHPTGVYGHGVSGTTFRTTAAAAGLVQEIERGGIRASYAIDYVIGSGNAAHGYLVRVGDAIFQSPVTYYTEQRRWGMAPGMEQEPAPDFTRPATPECLWCHAGRPHPRPGSVNRYEPPFLEPAPISCDRCHGPAEQHLRAPQAGSIVNPAALPPVERDSVCEQCHLGGAIRILNPGMTFGSFRPGRRLEEFWSVFVGHSDVGGGQNRFQVVSHVEQVALSRCAQETGDSFWCGTCHNPHELPQQPKAHFSQKCLNCHETALPTDHLGRKSDCISCHMARRQSHDSGHSAFTDHRITRHALSTAQTTPPVDLRPWRPIPAGLRLRNQGIANIHHGQQVDSPAFVRRGLEQLQRIKAPLRSEAGVLDAVGTALLLEGRSQAALGKLALAADLDSPGALLYNALASAWWAKGNSSATISSLEKAIAREPTLESSYLLLSRVYRELGMTAMERQIWQRLLEQRPRLIEARRRAQVSNSGTHP